MADSEPCAPAHLTFPVAQGHFKGRSLKKVRRQLVPSQGFRVDDCKFREGGSDYANVIDTIAPGNPPT